MLRKFDKLTLREGELMQTVTDQFGHKKYLLVLRTEYRKKAMRGIHNDVGV